MTALFEDERNELLWSAASTWELGIKEALGKLRLPEPLERFVPRQIRAQSLTGLPIYHDHAIRAAALPQVRPATRSIACSWRKPSSKTSRSSRAT